MPLTMKAKTYWKRATLAALGIGTTLGAIMLAIADSTNAQMEFRNHSGDVDYLFAIEVFASWLLTGVSATIAIAAILRLLSGSRSD